MILESVAVIVWPPTLDDGTMKVALNEPEAVVWIELGLVGSGVPSYVRVMPEDGAKFDPVTATDVPAGPLLGARAIDGDVGPPDPDDVVEVEVVVVEVSVVEDVVEEVVEEVVVVEPTVVVDVLVAVVVEVTVVVVVEPLLPPPPLLLPPGPDPGDGLQVQTLPLCVRA